MNKILLLFTLVFFIVSNFVCYYYFNSKLDYANDIIEKNKIKIQEYKAIIDDLNSKNNNSAEIQENYNCIYTQTFYIVGDYSYKGTVPTDKFIVVDKYQNLYPQIIKYNKDKFSFEKGKTYEITFESLVSDGKEIKRSIKEISLTDKQGMEQKQESCKKN